jgi:hypothetical protein
MSPVIENMNKAQVGAFTFPISTMAAAAGDLIGNTDETGPGEMVGQN